MLAELFMILRELWIVVALILTGGAYVAFRMIRESNMSIREREQRTNRTGRL